MLSYYNNHFRAFKLQQDITKLLRMRSGLPSAAGKLKRGDPVRIGYLGGSITQANGYRAMVTELLSEKYPQSNISGINAGIGGTGSTLGAFRLYNDILCHKPDLVFVEFAVNDCDTAPGRCLAAAEGIVRQIRQFNPTIDICFIYTINAALKKALDDGNQYWTVTNMEKIAGHYEIPSINLGPEVIAQEKTGALIYQLPRGSKAESNAKQAGKLVFSYDSVHPTLDDGHGLYSKIILSALEQLLTMPQTTPVAPDAPLSSSPWEETQMPSLSSAECSADWEKVSPEAENLTQVVNIQRLREIWKTSKTGAEIRFRFKGTGIGLFGLFGLNSGQFNVWVDGVEYPQVALFDKYGNHYRVHYSIIAEPLESGEHDVILQLDSEPPDRSVLSPNRPVDDPAKLAGLVAYIGNLLIIGKII